MRILGIDPGTAALGWGMIEKKTNNLSLVSSGCIFTRAGLDLADRLFIIYKEILKIIKKYKPDTMVCEELFFFKNLKTAIAVSHARGVILLAGKTCKIPVSEYTPLQIKQSLTGFGRAEKIQVQKMVKIILRLKNIIKQDDTNDAVAAAICHANSINPLSTSINTARRSGLRGIRTTSGHGSSEVAAATERESESSYEKIPSEGKFTSE